MTNIEIIHDYENNGKRPLLHQYRNQTSPQRAYVQMTSDGVVSVDYSAEIGNAVPAPFWHKRTLRWSIDPNLTAREIRGLLKNSKLLELLDRVHFGHSVEWNGNNYVGILTDDARAASEDIELLLSQVCTDEYDED